MHSMAVADLMKRWQVFLNPERGGFMTTGTDEHGVKVEQAAKSVGRDTKEFVDETSQSFKILADKAELDYDRFIRTTDKDHIEASQALWKILQENGYIYQGTHQGWYCVSDETFYPETQIMRETVTKDGKEVEQMVSRETGKPVEWTSEVNYFFALSKLRDRLLEHIRSNKQFIVPEEKYRFVENEVAQGLSDLSISRPRSRCSWGVPVPGDEENQVMYVWLDALTNYLTSTGFPWKSEQAYLDSQWPADVHVVGKDILRFHTIYWPAFLLAAGIPVPKQVVVHSHWTIEGTKMSKSLGNVVDPIDTINKYGIDSVRYFLANDSYLDHDTPFSNDRVQQRHNTDLVNRYGNLVVRICGPKFNINRSLAIDTDSIFENGQFSLPGIYDRHTALVKQTNELLSNVSRFMSQYDSARALDQVWNLIKEANLFVQDTAPWTYKSADQVNLQDALIKDSAECARVASIVLLPFLPLVANTMLDRLAVDKNKRSHQYAQYGADNSYGVSANRKGDYPIAGIE
ncbi:methionine--tRNA ligase MSM1 [Sugiyamaella lignohabitans]|uniref:Probable methionine--tRNA ligase, mitochondrial n=1 Tax=Sugiyamaella lignohabitans TaxID=796027 RepID=A0A167DB42_9ASCO|nr:methionine--tRNA ligase MSM1 [Sugiyamaella lignohabitans]ANB12701.1 methionine--tRNA ligase MSM1 [Sugiyamaella lignohabitans]